MASICILSLFLLRREVSGYLPWNADTAVIALGYFTFGDLFKNIDLSLIKNNKLLRYLSIGFIVSYFVITQNFRWESDFYYDMHCNRYDNPILSLSLTFIGLLSILLFTMTNNCGYFLRLVGKNTLVIYAFNMTLGISLITRILKYVGFYKIVKNEYFEVIIVAFVVSVFLLLISWFINKYFPFVLGKNSHHKENVK